MKPTHILVPIDKLAPEYVERIYTNGYIYQFPKVDLSEKGIKKRAKTIFTWNNLQNKTTQELQQEAYLYFGRELLKQ